MDLNVRRGELINIAATAFRTKALGPGLRNAVWFQGCPFRCPGCISPDWIVDKDVELISPDKLANILINDPMIEGITISGGEPFYQPLGLYFLLKQVHEKRPDLTVILFSGFVLEKLDDFPSEMNTKETLSFVDILVDGVFIQAKNNNKGLRGSTNQRIHRLKNRYQGVNFEEMERVNEIYLRKTEIQLVGVPDIQLSRLIPFGPIFMKD